MSIEKLCARIRLYLPVIIKITDADFNMLKDPANEDYVYDGMKVVVRDDVFFCLNNKWHRMCLCPNA